MRPFLSNRLAPSRLPLRIRLTLWYTLSLGLILLLFVAFLYLQFWRSLIGQVDAALELAAAQAQLNLGTGEGGLTLHSPGSSPEAIGRLSEDFAIRLLDENGGLIDTLANDDQHPVFPAGTEGFDTLLVEGDLWRVYGVGVSAGGRSGRLLVGQELDRVVATLTSLQTQIFLGLPLALFLAGLGGFFLAGRALQPIDRMTRTAQAITASDLDRRIRYAGPPDEIGRLAATLDTMLERLQAAFARERRFTGDAAHELRTPLAALKGRIGVTLSRPRSPEDYARTLQVMEEQVDRLIRLSSDLLFMARLDQGDIRPQSARIELDRFLAAVVDQIQPLAAAKTVDLEVAVPAGLAIDGDMDLLIRLAFNLLDNAVKYSPAGGRVVVLGEERPGQVLVIVRDSGPGIPAEHLPHLFDRFYRAEADRTRAETNGQGGAGLGLAIAYEIARAHGGTLAVDSVPGQGTDFRVTLPQRPACSAPTARAKRPPSAS